AGL
ncbi:aminotransferase class-V family protein, partial [Vibrio parahaemolyticus V-223/04]